MLKIPYVAKGFPPRFGWHFSPISDIRCSWPDIVRSAITVGRLGWFHILRHGRYSGFEAISRAFRIRANLMQDAAGHIVRTDAYDGLDPSEKGSVTYSIGLTITKLLSEWLLGIPWLMHLDIYSARLQPVLAKGKKGRT